MKNSSSPESSDILFFDGVCNLCNSFVDFVVRHNTDLKIASLQGETAKKSLPPQMFESLTSLVLLENGKTYVTSAAALRVFRRLGGLYFLMSIFILVPPPIRDMVYRWVASHRYQWFGKRETCRLPSPEERARFLP